MQVELNNIPITELQLAGQLGECIQSERRYDFSLMLAMLTVDVRDHSQFKLPVPEEIILKDSEQQLRKKFNLPPKVSLSIQYPHRLACFNQAQNILDQQFSSIILENTLKAKPIAFRDDDKYISSDVISNTSIHCQKRYSDNTVGDKLGYNANVWLDAIETSMRKAPMLKL